MTSSDFGWRLLYEAGFRHEYKKAAKAANNEKLGRGIEMKSVWRTGMTGVALACSQPALAEYAVAFQAPMDGVTQGAFPLNNLIMLMCLCVFVAVFAAMFYSLFKHRKSTGNPGGHFHANTMVEVVWTAIPFLILVGMAYPATKSIIEHHAAGDIQLDEQQVASR
jgi:heme/copper-type cytochrome/quinol oxidase subunit 2